MTAWRNDQLKTVLCFRTRKWAVCCKPTTILCCLTFPYVWVSTKIVCNTLECIVWKWSFKVTCFWKFIQRLFIASKLNAGCSGYPNKIYKILVDVLILKLVFHLQIFSLEVTFSFKNNILLFFTSKKVANQYVSKKSHFEQKNSQVENRISWPT